MSLLGGSLLGGTPAPAQQGQQQALLPQPGGQQQVQAPAVPTGPISYTKYTLQDVLCDSLSAAVRAFLSEQSTQHVARLQTAVASAQRRLRNPMWLPPKEAEALTAVKSLDTPQKTVSDLAIDLADKFGVNEHVAARLISHAQQEDSSGAGA